MSAKSFVVFLAVVAVVGLLAYGLLTKGGADIAVGDIAPSGQLPRLDGHGTASLADYRGHWVLVNFWASWCLPCRDESPALQAFYRRFRSRNFTVLGIDTRDLSDDGQSFVKQYGLTYPELRDGNGNAGHDYGTSGVPENFLVNPKGKLVLIQRGPVDESFLNRYVAPLLG